MLRLILLVALLGMATGSFADEQARTITVSGTGSAEIAPDRATVFMSVSAIEPTLDAAQKAAAEVTGKVLGMLDRMEVDREQVNTTGASVQPNYRWNSDKKQQELIGFIAGRQITIELDDLEKLGAVIEGAVSAGVNMVQPPQLDSSRRKQVQREALRAAAEDARANALELAESLGTELGRVMSISSGDNTPYPHASRAANMFSMGAAQDATESYNAAGLSFNAVVTVVFELSE